MLERGIGVEEKKEREGEVEEVGEGEKGWEEEGKENYKERNLKNKY